MKIYRVLLKGLLMLTIVCFASCHNPHPDPSVLYASPEYVLYKTEVAQGNNLATIHSPTHIHSNYKSPAGATFPRLIIFKFSVNEKDNEMPPGSDHWVLIGDEHESRVYTFGEKPEPQPERPETYLPPNYEYTFRVDMTPVIKQLDEKGYYEGWDGSKVSKAELKGFYIAGNALPLSWDFVGLEEKGLKLEPTGEGNIYAVTVKLNPYNEADVQEKDWKLSLDLSNRPRYQSEQPIVDAMFNLSMEEAIKNIEPDSTFRTGAKWGGVWTRDISYSIFLAFAYHEPEVAKISLRKKVKRGRIVQDTGSGGAWPVSSDRTTWALAAWEIYKATGDEAWLDEIYPIIKNSLEDDYKNLFDPTTGMYRGESSFLDWREQTYPKWMNNLDIAVSENLGTNAVHYKAHLILAEMAKLKGEPFEIYTQRAANIAKGMNEHLWMNDRGYFAQYLYGRPHLTVSPRAETLGEALSVLFGVADEQRSASVIAKSPLTYYGATCIYPQIPAIPPYHNNAIWPFVQSYWNLAAAKVGNEEVLNHGLASIYRAGAFFLSNYENMVAQTGDHLGTEINSDRMLWSMAGNLAMVYRVFMGLSFETDGLRFQPVIPEVYGGQRSLTNFKYRNAVLDISIQGHGKTIAKVMVDGIEQKEAFIPASLSGRHRIEIEMANAPFPHQGISLVKNAFSLTTPRAQRQGDTLQWEALTGAKSYNIYRNGVLNQTTSSTKVNVPGEIFAEYKVSALDENGFESFTSEPILFAADPMIFQMEQYATRSGKPYTDFSGTGFIELSTSLNKSVVCEVIVKEAGTYAIDFRYSNGSGHWNTDNMCAIRSLTVNGQYKGAVIFPQRGKDEWSDWSYTNSYSLSLKKGANTIKLTFEEWNHNMNVDVNTAMVDCMRLVKLIPLKDPR